MANSNGYAKTGVYASVFIAASTLLIAFIWVGSIAAQVAQNKSDLGGLVTRMGKIEDAVSSAGLADLPRRVATLESDLRENDTATAIIGRDLREIETQCRAIENQSNLIHAYDLRQIAVLYEKVFGGMYHTDNAFYPDICRVNN